VVLLSGPTWALTCADTGPVLVPFRK